MELVEQAYKAYFACKLKNLSPSLTLTILNPPVNDFRFIHHLKTEKETTALANQSAWK